MQTKPTNWDTIFASEHKCVTKLIVGDVTYNQDKIISVQTSGSLYDEFGIGNCCSRMLQVKFYPTTTPARQAQVQVQCALSGKISTWNKYNANFSWSNLIRLIIEIEEGTTTTLIGFTSCKASYSQSENKNYLIGAGESGTISWTSSNPATVQQLQSFFSSYPYWYVYYEGSQSDFYLLWHDAGTINISSSELSLFTYGYPSITKGSLVGEVTNSNENAYPQDACQDGYWYTKTSPSSATTSYIPKGTFFISKRETDHTSGLLTLTCYDSMLKAEQPFTNVFPTTASWSQNPTTVVNTIATAIGITVDNRTQLNNSFLVSYPVDEDGDMTLREILGRIAVANAGNWIITESNQLYLAPLNPTGAAISIGTSCHSFNKGVESEAITLVEVLNQSGELIESYGTTTGKTLTVTYPDADGEGTVASYIHGKVNGYTQIGCSISEAVIDPAIEIGDKITVGETGNTLTTVIGSATFSFGSSRYLCELIAPDADEVDDEYPYQTYQQRTERKIASTYSAIKKSAEEISLLVSGIADAWTSNTSYALNDVVGYEGKFYKCTTAHTSGITFDATKWSEISNGIVQSIFSQTKNKISIGVTSAAGSSTFTIKQGGIDIATETLNLTVSSAYISGILSATQIDTSQLVVGDNIAMGANATISWNKVTNQPTILSTNDVNGLIGTYIDSTSIAAAYLKGQYIYIYGSDGITRYGTIYAGTNTEKTTALELYGHNGLRLTSNGNTFLTGSNGGLILLGYDTSQGASGMATTPGTHINNLICGSYLCMGSGYYGTSEPSSITGLTAYEGMLYFKITS